MFSQYVLELGDARNTWNKETKEDEWCLSAPQDPFGNYVVQYVLELGDGAASGAVMRGLQGHYPELAQQKFSSNVVEKCLKLPGLTSTQVPPNLIEAPLP